MVFLAVALAGSVAGCGGSRPAPPAASVARSTTPQPNWVNDFFASAVPTQGSPKRPSAVIARVGSAKITRSAFLARLKMAARSQTEPGHPLIVPLPPGYRSCVVLLQAEATGFGTSPSASPAHLRADCARSYRQYLRSAMTELISSAWVRQGAREEGLHVSAAEDRRSVERGLTTVFPTPAKLRAYLTGGGETVGDMLFGAETQLLSGKLRDKLNATVPRVTPATIASYYAGHRARYHVPEQRDLGIIHTKHRHTALVVEKELQNGASFAAIAKRLAKEQPIKAHEGLLTGFKHGTFREASLNRAIFATPLNAFGPIVHLNLFPGYNPRFHRNPADINNIDGYYVFKIQAIRPGHTKPLTTVEPTLKKTLPELLSKEALVKYIARWRARLRAKTVCALGYVVRKCRQYAASAREQPEDPYTLN
jgi:PPIC-type PPIASE domain